MDTVKQYKVVAVTIWITLAVIILCGLAVVAMKKSLDRAAQSLGDDTGLPIMFDAPAFALTNQDGQPATAATFAGKPYVAAFIYTTCTTACPMMTGKMTTLQDTVATNGVKLVSFTVDPERDTPEVLKAYAGKFSAHTDRWFFLTGTKQQMTAVEQGFFVRVPEAKVAEMNKAREGTTQPAIAAEELHSDRFFLIDGRGRVRGVYDAKDDVSMMRLKTDSAKLASGEVK